MPSILFLTNEMTVSGKNCRAKLWRRERWLAERGREEMERNGRGKMNKVHYLSSLLRPQITF